MPLMAWARMPMSGERLAADRSESLDRSRALPSVHGVDRSSVGVGSERGRQADGSRASRAGHHAESDAQSSRVDRRPGDHSAFRRRSDHRRRLPPLTESQPAVLRATTRSCSRVERCRAKRALARRLVAACRGGLSTKSMQAVHVQTCSDSPMRVLTLGPDHLTRRTPNKREARTPCASGRVSSSVLAVAAPAILTAEVHSHLCRRA
jgi:hypothetical protein